MVHAGVLIYFVAFSGMAFRREIEATLKPGESATLSSPFGHTYTLTHVGISQFEALNRIVSAATVSVVKDGRSMGLLTSEKRQHVDSFRRPTFEPSTEVGIRSNLQEDLYITFAGSVGGTEEAVSVVSQSRAFMSCLIDLAAHEGIGIAKAVNAPLWDDG